MTSPRPFNGLLLAGLLGTLIIGGTLIAGLVEIYRGDPRHYWTHRDMRLALPETRDMLEVYIGGELLRKHLERKGLTTTGPDGTAYPVMEQDIRIRLNNWPERRADLSVRSIPEALLTGISSACLALGLYQVRQQRKKS